MQVILRKVLPKGALVRGASVLLGGNALAQMLLILISPLLTRMYTPADFGVLAVYASCLAILGSIACLRYPQAIPFVKDTGDAAAVALLSFCALVLFTLVVSGVGYCYRLVIVDALGVPGLLPYLWMVPVGLIILGSFQILNAWAVRDREYGNIARSRLWQSVCMSTIQIVFFKLGAPTLLAGHALGQGAGIFSLGRSALKTGLGTAGKIRPRVIITLAQRLREYPLFSTPTSLCSAMGNQLPPILLAVWFGPVVAGVYMLAYRILMLPLQVIGQAIEDAFSSSARESSEKGRLGGMLLKVANTLSGLLMAPFMLGALLAPQVFAFTFGAEWRDSGIFVQWLMPFAFVALISAPVGKVYMVLERQRVGLYFSILALVLKIVALAAGAWQGSVLVAIAFFSLAACLVRYLSFMWACYALEVSGAKLSFRLLRELVFSLLVTAPVWFALISQWQEFYIWWAVIVAALLVALRVLWAAKQLYRV